MARRKGLIPFLFLYPLSLLYGLGVAVRNMMFDKGILKQHKFNIPVIVVGNLTVGGAGKTPHAEHIIGMLKSDYRIGLLSRGYKRNTKGFVLAGDNSRPQDIGDEPYQMYRKFRHDGVMVAVCESRVRGIETMLELNPSLNLIVLDDAFQHRYVKPSISVLLTEHSRPVYNDALLPYGRLREPARAIDRADVVVMTKCPDDMKPVDFRIFKETFNLFPFQKLLFTRYKYLPPKALFPENVSEETNLKLDILTREDTLLAVTGVANPRPFIRYLRKHYCAKVKILRFDDHHNFTNSDMQSILRKFKTMEGRHKFVVTTEKDAVRLANNPYFPPQLRGFSYYIPIAVEQIPSGDPPLESILRQLLRNQGSIR